MERHEEHARRVRRKGSGLGPRDTEHTYESISGILINCAQRFVAHMARCAMR